MKKLVFVLGIIVTAISFIYFNTNYKIVNKDTLTQATMTTNKVAKSNEKNEDTDKDEVKKEESEIKKEDTSNEINTTNTKKEDKKEEEKKNEPTNEFNKLFTNTLEGVFDIEGKEGKMNLVFRDSFNGEMRFSMKPVLPDDINVEKINLPILQFKIDEMDVKNNYIVLNGYSIEKTPIMFNGEDISNDIKFYLPNEKELEPMIFKAWFKYGEFTGFIEKDSKPVGKFTLKIKEGK